MNGPDTCARCGRRPTADSDGWNAVYVNGRQVQVICPECQTPEESEEAEDRLPETLTASSVADGRIVDRDEFVALNSAAVAAELPSAVDAFVDDNGPVFLGLLCGTYEDRGLVMFMPVDIPVERITTDTGDVRKLELPITISAGGTLASPVVFVDVALVDWMGFEQCFVAPADWQALASTLGARYVQSLAVEDD